MNLLGRKKYPATMNAKDFIDKSFNDCWKGIFRLFVLQVISLIYVLRHMKKFH